MKKQKYKDDFRNAIRGICIEYGNKYDGLELVINLLNYCADILVAVYGIETTVHILENFVKEVTPSLEKYKKHTQGKWKNK